MRYVEVGKTVTNLSIYIGTSSTDSTKWRCDNSASHFSQNISPKSSSYDKFKFIGWKNDETYFLLEKMNITKQLHDNSYT